MKDSKYDIIQFLNETLYNPDKLSVDLPKQKWYKINPTRGIKKNIYQFDLSNSRNEFSIFINEVFGLTKYCPTIIENKLLHFFKRDVACGGGLYPNNIYLIKKQKDKLFIYQYNPWFNSLNFIASILDENNILLEEESFLVFSEYYWKNWPKYNYFGYRLMLVDSGYLMAHASILLSGKSKRHEVHLDSNLHNELYKILQIDTSFESLVGVIKMFYPFDLTSIIMEDKNIIEYSLSDDWDSEDNLLYDSIEKNILSEDYRIIQMIDCDITSSIKFNNNWKKYRVSPGGGAMISRKKFSQNKLLYLLSDFYQLMTKYHNLSEGIKFYIYINKVECLESGFYTFDSRGLSFIDKVESYKFQNILRKKNFNLNEVQVMFFFASEIDLYDSAFKLSDYKNTQVKVGFISQILTYVACQYCCYTHPILGYDIGKLEKFFLTDEIVLNLVLLSDAKNSILHKIYIERGV
ncbi:hypothetical protein AB1F57_02115 [Streptococcus sp. ZY1909104]|uniref:hypothetical protein n=1 Tax=Streptococcus sp. ZY1909104 TaxID=3233335 RepID=UPI0029901EC3|nr:hypothetical protein [Streptococcus suis]